MINTEVFFKVPYGMYVVCSGNKTCGNGFIATVVFQVTAQPIQFGVCCNKDNHTATLIQQSGVFSISVLSEKTSVDIIRDFGFKSGKNNVNKMEGRDIKCGLMEVPVLMENIVAYLECKLVQTVDVGTHYIFIGEVVNAEMIDSEAETMTYMYYRNVMKGKSPKNAPTYIDKSIKY